MARELDCDLDGRRILVVEDEVMVSWLLEDMLVALGGVVVGPAARIDQALSLIAVQTPADPLAAAVVDVNLNGEMSYAVADALVAGGVPFMFSSGYESHRLPPRYGSVPVLRKPYQEQDLARILAGLLTPPADAAL